LPKKTVATIVQSGNHYTIQVKENQPNLYKDIEQTAATAPYLSTFEQENKGHGWLEKRCVRVYQASNHPHLEGWADLKTYVVVERWRTENGEQSQEKSLYISDLLLSAQAYYEGTRGHWGIENRLHYVKDVVHNEDNNGVNTGSAPLVLAICSTIAINIHRKEGHNSISYGQIKFGARVQDVLKIMRT
jgi:predicted transposase YbfD/YdcC